MNDGNGPWVLTAAMVLFTGICLLLNQNPVVIGSFGMAMLFVVYILTKDKK